MGFDKNYPNRKDWRKPYRKSKAFDSSCRNHGGCKRCYSDRMHKHNKKLVKDRYGTD